MTPGPQASRRGHRLTSRTGGRPPRPANGGTALVAAGLGALSVQSAEVPPFLRVGEPRHVLTTEHVDLKVVLAPEGTNLLQLVLRDHLRSTNRPALRTAMRVPEAARLSIPEGFEGLGPAGSDLWVLPASQDPRFLYLGLSTEGLALPPQTLDLFVRRIDGPAHFCIWQFDGAGGLSLSVQSRDGLTESDRLQLPVGSHAHHNLGLSASGVTTVWLQARATVGGTNAWSPETPFVFSVEPLPALPSRLAFAPPVSSGSIDLSLTGTPGRTTRLETSTNLVEWESLGPVTADFDPVVLTLPAPVASPTRFFRTR
jgi:hypothetical protein